MRQQGRGVRVPLGRVNISYSITDHKGEKRKLESNPRGLDRMDAHRSGWKITLMGAGALGTSISKPVVIANPGSYAVVVLVNIHAHPFSFPLSLALSFFLMQAQNPTHARAQSLLTLTPLSHTHTLFLSTHQSFPDEEARSVMGMVVVV